MEAQNGFCKHNKIIECHEICRKDCGWNPEEMDKRKFRLRRNDFEIHNGLKTLIVKGKRYE